MGTTPVKVLLVEDNPGDARLVREMLSDARSSVWEVTLVDRLSAAFEALEAEVFDLLLLDLSLPDSRGLETFERAQARVPDLPVVLLTGFEDEETAVNALHAGAQDYLVKGQIDAFLLERSLTYAVERKRAQEKILSQAMLLEQARDAILVRDAWDRITYWNEGAERLYGWTVGEATGRDVDELLFAAGEAGAQLPETIVALDEKGEWRGELRQVTKDGREIIVESRWTLVRNSRGQAVSKLVVNTDITDKKRLEAELLRAAQLSLVGELAAGLAHEIKNPLAGIKGAVDILIMRRAPSDGERGVLEEIRSEVERIDATVRELLGRARPRAMSIASASFTHVVRRAVRLARDQAAGVAVAIELDAPDDPIVLSIDVPQMEDAVLNVVLNALAAVGENGRIVVRVRSEETTAGRTAVVEVEDNGRGISEADLARIFAPFFTTSPQGTGLGLPAVRRIVRAHGGRVDATSTLGHGSVFTITLPVSKGS